MIYLNALSNVWREQPLFYFKYTYEGILHAWFKVQKVLFTRLLHKYQMIRIYKNLLSDKKIKNNTTV